MRAFNYRIKPRRVAMKFLNKAMLLIMTGLFYNYALGEGVIQFEPFDLYILEQLNEKALMDRLGYLNRILVAVVKAQGSEFSKAIDEKIIKIEQLDIFKLLYQMGAIAQDDYEKAVKFNKSDIELLDQILNS